MTWDVRLTKCIFPVIFFTAGCSGLQTPDQSPAQVWLKADEVPRPAIFEPRNAVDLTNFLRSDRVFLDKWFPLIDETRAREVLQACPNGVIVLGSDAESSTFTDSGFVLGEYQCAETNANPVKALREVPPDRFRDDWLRSPNTYMEHADLSTGPQDRTHAVNPKQPQRSLADPWFHAVMVRRCGSIDYRTLGHVWTDRGWIAAQIKCQPLVLASTPKRKRKHKRIPFLKDPTYVCIRSPGVTCGLVRR